MNKILRKEQLSDLVWRYRLEAPRIAKKRQAGQFVILRVDSEGERIPFTISNANAQDGWVEIIFQAVGYSTLRLSQLQEGDSIADLLGPLGHPTHIENFGRCLCIGGGVGIAPLYPIVCALKAAGNHVTTIIGARNKDLLILENEMLKQSDQLFIATDDGSKGHHGFVSDVFNELIENGGLFDHSFVIGPPIMMKVTSSITISQNIKTYVSLNPIMIDGTGMCGGCRVTVFDETKFACVDGPEFDAAGINWDEFIKRLDSYKSFEQQAREHFKCKLEENL